MTLTEYQGFLHSLYQGDGSTPSDGSDEWNHRENLLAAAIGIWDAETTFWNELWTTLSDSAAALSGDKTVLTNSATYDMPTNFRFLGSWVRVTDSSGDHTYYQVLKPQDAEKYKNTSVKGVYITGNKSAGHDITFLEIPTAGNTINYPYYKEPTVPSSASDIIEMGDPWFGVYYALGKLHEHDGDGDRAQAAFSQAEQKLKNMKVRNMLLPHDQPNSPGDLTDGFGVTGAWGVSRYGEPL